MTAPSDDDRFNTEVVKVLLKLSMSDGEADEREQQMILGLGRSWSVAEHELQSLLGLLETGGPLPEPDVALLKTRADDVLMAARALVLTDGKVKPEETAMLKSLQKMLA